MAQSPLPGPPPQGGRGDHRLRALFDRAGARWVELPVLYPADPFLETAGEDIRRRMFVTEGPRGERLALRPDFTIPVCLHHLDRGNGTARYAYRGLVFRRHDTGAPERPETGCEDIGRADRMAADAETLALAVAAADALSLRRLTVRLGDIGLFVALLNALGLPEPWRRRLRRSFGLARIMAAQLARLSSPRQDEDARLDPELRGMAAQNDRNGMVQLLDARLAAHGHMAGAGRSAAEIADRFLDQRPLSEARIELSVLETLRAYLELETDLAGAPAMLADFAAARGIDLGEPLALFNERAAMIAGLAPAAAIRFEAGFGRPLDYYTGLVFEIRAGDMAQPVSGGGRYDRLMELLGAPRPVPAVGFTMRLDLGTGEGGR